MKIILHAGRGAKPEFVEGAKAVFDYAAKIKEEGEERVIDDTRKAWPHGYGQPLELVFGKKFQIPVWEECLKTMCLDEIASFDIPDDKLPTYPMVSKKLRDIGRKRDRKPGDEDASDHSHSSCFGLAAQMGTGYPELDSLIHDSKPITFVFHLHKTEAINFYKEAMGRFDTLQMREKPGEPEWLEIEDAKVPFFLNLSLCYLKTTLFYYAIETASEALKIQPHNEKALFRRAKAYVEVWELDKAKEDFESLQQLHPHSKGLVEKELKEIKQREVKKFAEEKERYKSMVAH